MERRRGMFFNYIKLVYLFILLTPFSLYGASSLDVGPSDSTYHYLDLLTSHGLIKTAIVGQRPYSREEVARLLVEARKNWDGAGKKSEWVEKVLVRMEEGFRDEILEFKGEKKRKVEVNLLDTLEYRFTFLDSNPKIFPVNNGVGSISAFSQPLVEYRQGRDYVDGAQYSIESEHWAHMTPYSSFYLRPRFQFQFASGAAEDTNKAFVQELYGVFNYKNVELQAGRSSLLFGQGEHGGLILSDHARPLDHVHLTNDHPVILPWIFKYLGQNKLTLFWGNLGPESFFPYTHLAGYKWTIKPFPVWEAGFSNVMIIGGDGAPDFGVGDFLGDFVGFSGTNEGVSNRILGIDTRVTFPSLRHTQIYGEFFFDDKTIENLKKTFVDDAAYISGVLIPRLNDSGTLSASLEFSYVSERFYRHNQFQEGYTLNGEILGYPLGPDGYGFTSKIRWNISTDLLVSWVFSYNKSDSDIYQFLGDSVEVLTDNPSESRFRFTFSSRYLYKDRFKILNDFGYERVVNFSHLVRDNRNNILAEIGLRIDFGKH